MNNFCDSIIDQYGGINVIINNAGITDDNLFMRMSENSWDKVFAINIDASMIFAESLFVGW